MPDQPTSLTDLLGIADLDHDSVVTVLSNFLPRGEWESGEVVTYRTDEGEVGLTLTYKKGVLQGVARGPGLTDEAVEELRQQMSLLAEPRETAVWRDVFFNVRPVEGYWRYRDEWQIVPAPPEAATTGVVTGDDPFIVEIRVPRFDEPIALNMTVRQRRAFEIHMLLNLSVRDHVTRFTPRCQGHVWVYDELTVGPGARWAQPGYSIPGWIYQSPEFSSTDDLAPITEVPEEDYAQRRGLGAEEVFEVTDRLSPLFDAYHAASPETRDRFLRACYWLERSAFAWNHSVSLGHIAAVNAIEVLLDKPDPDLCPTCGRDKGPGPTRLFREFVERYATGTTADERNGIYRLRSSLVHGSRLLDIDLPRAWGALTPTQWEQSDTYATARAAARSALINWLLDR